MSIRDKIHRGWDDHADDAAGVWATLAELDPATPGELFQLAALTAHVGGDHLGDWTGALARLDALRTHAHFDRDSDEGRGVRRLMASLHLCAGDPTSADAAIADAATEHQPEPMVRARVLAVSASAWCGHRQVNQATKALDQAVELAGEQPPAAVARALAVTANNLAADLAEQDVRSPTEEGLMLRAAVMSRRYWAMVGTWENLRIAEVRLAECHLAARQPQTARMHVQNALALVDAHGGTEGDRFFALVAGVRVHRALEAHTEADALLARARDAVAHTTDGMRPWCEKALADLG
ncbi:MAG: hypothetical protein EP330_21370 [Deltaproteobacteria bacterium]|nr:MAG: hypothetical protein EP330_21370 [Deltaproteobacteria bacterium]